MSKVEHPIGREGYREGLRQLALLQNIQMAVPPHFKRFTHRSFANEAIPREDHNERLEFLGDAVLI